MIELLYSIDKSIFIFFNQTISNPLFDVSMPIITDLNKHWWGLTLFGLIWCLLFFAGGKKGKTVALLLLVVIAVTDQLNSNLLKNIVDRPRPCREIDGKTIVENVRLLVGCGGGHSFPSSHAANNFAAACLLSFYFRRWKRGFYLFAGMVAFSRISVGVHYPSDILGGAVVGFICASVIIFSWNLLVSYYPRLDYATFSKTHSEEP